MSVLVALAILCVSLHDVVADGGKGPPAWGCYPSNKSGNPDHVTLIHVNYTLGHVGFVHTPNFPDRFPLPLRCVWVFNNTEERRKDNAWRINFYLTQFYITPEYFSAACLNSSADLNLTEHVGWKAINNLGNKVSGFNWHLYKKLWFSNDDYYLLKLNIEATKYDYLHKRVLEVNDVYGLNITFEATNKVSFRNSCSLLECNLNGECFSEVDLDDPGKLSGFRCDCSVPRFSPTKIDDPFNGRRCQYHNKHKECTFTDQATCKNGGTCRYFTSRYVVCDCPPGWSGPTCEMPDDAKVYKVRGTSSNSCSRFFYQNEYKTSIANEIMSTAHRHDASNLYKIDSKETGNSTIFYEFHGNATTIPVNIISRVNDQEPLKNIALCVQESLLLTVERSNTSLVVRDEEFSLTCIARGYKNPVFVWKKDSLYAIDPLMSITTQHPINPSNFLYVAKHFERRHITVWPIEPNSEMSEFHNVITIGPANIYDNGLFSCTVYETLNENFNSSDMKLFPRQTASLRINVLTKPRIEVYPKSLTIIEECRESINPSELCKKVTIHNTLHCFVLSNVDNATALHYRFFWQKDGRNLSELIQRDEHEDEMWEPYGKSLSIGKIQNRTNFTCVAYDHRYPDVISSETVTVSVAKTIDETCRTTTIAQQLWPFTVKGEEAYVKCTKASGYSSLRCQRDQGALKWMEHIADNNECLGDTLFGWQRRIERFLSGYSKDSTDEQILFNFTSNFENIVNSKALTRREQQVVFALLSKMFWAMYSKPFNLDFSVMSDRFYSKCLPHIINPPSGTKHNLENLLEAFDLIRTSALVFGSSLTKPDKSIKDRRIFSWEEPFTAGCFHDMKVAVKLVHITNSPKNSYERIWPMAPQTSPKENNIIQTKEYLPNSTLCFGLFRVSFNLTAPYDSFIFNAKPVVSIVYFRDLEDHLKTDLSTGETLRQGDINFVRNSSLATIVYGQNISYTVMPQLSISIRFLDSVFPNANESAKFNLCCASINWHSEIGTHAWKVPDKDCNLVWHPEGMMCICTKPGTFGLVKAWSLGENSDESKSVDGSSVVILCCGISLTLMTLAGIFLIIEIRKRPSMMTFLTLEIIVANVVIIGLVTLSVSSSPEEYSDYSLSTSLQFFLILTQCLLISLVATLYTKSISISHTNCSKILLGLAILIPSLYVAVAFKLQVGFPKYSKKFSFVKMSTPLFSVFFGLLSSLLVIFAIVFSIVLRKIPPSYGNVSKRKRLLMGAAIQTFVNYLFVIALIVYTNGIVQFGKELLLAAACLLVGVAASTLFVIKRQFKIKASEDKAFSDLPKDQRHCFVNLGEKVGNKGCSTKRCSNLCPKDDITTNRYFVQHQKDARLRHGSDNSDTSVLMSNIFMSEVDGPLRDLADVCVDKSKPDQTCEDRTVDEVLKLSDISDLSPEPLYEVLKIVQGCGDLALRGATGSPEKTTVRHPSSCSSGGSTTIRSRRNTDSGNETRSISNASDHKIETWKLKKMPLNEENMRNNSGTYVAMKPQKYSANNLKVLKNDDSSKDQETDGLLPRRGRHLARPYKDVDFSTELESSQDEDSHWKSHRSNTSLKGEPHRARKRKTRRNLPTSFSAPLISKEGNFQNLL